MLAEVLLSLSGHPSSLLNNENLNPSKNQVPLSLHSKSLDSPLHPSELESLSSLKLLSSRFLRIQTFSKGQLDLARRHSLRSAGVRIAKSSSKTKDDGGGVSYRCSHLSPLCSTLLSITREYQDLILDLQKSILERRNDGGFLSLNSIKAKVEGWVEPLDCLNRLIDELIAGPKNSNSRTVIGSSEVASTEWTGGLLLDLLSFKSNTSVGKTKACMTLLLNSVQRSWSMKLVDWITHGEASPSSNNSDFNDNLVEIDVSNLDQEEEGGSKLDHCLFVGKDQAVTSSASAPSGSSSSDGGPIYRFRPNALPSSIDSKTSDSILYVGRALSTIRRSSLAATFSSSSNGNGNDNHKLPDFMTQKHSEMLRESGPCSIDNSRSQAGSSSNGLTPKVAFARVVESIREDVSEWIWRNVLTKETVLRALEDLGSIFLHRSGVFQLSFLSTLEAVEKKDSGKMKISDLERVLHRASIGTELEDDPSLDTVKWSMPSMSSKTSSSGAMDAQGKPAKQRGAQGSTGVVRFDDLLLPGKKRIQLHYSASYPLDLFLSPSDLASYSRIFSYFSAFRSTHSGLLKAWQGLSQSQRKRRQFTGSGEGGSDLSEEKTRGRLLRRAWGINRLMLWFLDTMMEHLMTDVVDVQYSRLIDQLGGTQQRGRAEDESDLLPPSPMIPTSTSTNEMPPPSSTIPLRSQASSSSLRKFNPSNSPTKRNVELPFPQVASSRRQSVPSSAMSSTTIGGGSTFKRGMGGGFAASYSVRDGQSVFGGSSATARTITPTRSIFGGVGAPSLRSFGGRGRTYSTPTAAGNLSNNADPNGSLDFASLRAIHSSFLSFLLDGTLLSSNVASAQIRKILETCQLFTGSLMGKYRGDILPELLGEGSLADGGAGKSKKGTLEERIEFIEDISRTLDSQLQDFFSLLSSASSPLNRGGSNSSTAVGGGSDSLAADVSLSNMSFSLPLPQRTGFAQNDKERERMNEVRLEADVAARRHLEQLLLRLDYNRHFESEAEKREEKEEGGEGV